MNKIKQLTDYYLNHILKLGRNQFLVLIIVLLVIVPFFIQLLSVYLFNKAEHFGRANIIYLLIISIILSITLVYFILYTVKELQKSRQRLSNAIIQLKEARNRDTVLTMKLKKNVETLNQQIATREDAEKALYDQTVILKNYMNLSPDPIFQRNEKHEFTWCNRATIELFGSPDKELIGLKPTDIFPKETAKTIIDADNTVLGKNTVVTTELWVTNHKNEQVCFEIKKTPIYDNETGKQLGLLGFGRDITAHKNYENLLKKANREKTTFISTLSHELRTPLNAIIGLCKMLLDTELNTSQREYQETIYASAMMLSVILNDVIELDRLEQEKIIINRTPLEKNHFLSNLERIARTMLHFKDITLSFDIDSSCPSYLMIDETRFNQILWNLIHNAIKFTKKGEIALKAWYDKKRQILYFSVKDTGIGIPQNELDKIFSMYYQVKNEQSGIGTGIGLAISKRIAQAMGGDIVVTSTVGEGSCFTISIYAPITNQQEHKDMLQQITTTVSLCILLVEDIELNILVAKSILEKLGHTIQTAQTGKEAIERFVPDRYDLILLDIQLPDISGLDVVQELRQTYNPVQLPPIVAFTANALLKDRQKYLDMGINNIITKPFSISDFNHVVNQYWPIKSNTQDNETKAILEKTKDKTINSGRLNEETLKQYLELLGVDTLLESVAIFSEIMPSYIENLQHYAKTNDEKALTEEAHKIKGATGSLGLLYLQKIAQNLQNNTQPNWYQNVSYWIDQMAVNWRGDLSLLEKWLKNNSVIMINHKS